MTPHKWITKYSNVFDYFRKVYCQYQVCAKCGFERQYPIKSPEVEHDCSLQLVKKILES